MTPIAIKNKLRIVTILISDKVLADKEINEVWAVASTTSLILESRSLHINSPPKKTAIITRNILVLPSIVSINL